MDPGAGRPTGHGACCLLVTAKRSKKIGVFKSPGYTLHGRSTVYPVSTLHVGRSERSRQNGVQGKHASCRQGPRDPDPSAPSLTDRWTPPRVRFGVVEPGPDPPTEPIAGRPCATDGWRRGGARSNTSAALASSG